MIYEYSLELHKIGLNLNASKTKCYTKREIIKYRCLDIVSALESQDIDKINCAIDWFKDRVIEGVEKCREDTISKHLLTLLSNKPREYDNEQYYYNWNNWQERKQHKEWLRDYILTKGYELIRIFDSNKLAKLIRFFPNLREGFDKITSIIIDKPYTSPKVEMLRAIASIRKEEKNDTVMIKLCDHYRQLILDNAKDCALISQYSKSI